MRKGIVLAVFVVVVITTGLTYSKITQSRLEASYRVAIAPFKRDLRIGMDRTEVKNYLNSHSVICNTVQYGGGDGDTCEIKIGEEPDGIFCDPWTVYIALEFSPDDKLLEIHIRKTGTCL